MGFSLQCKMANVQVTIWYLYIYMLSVYGRNNYSDAWCTRTWPCRGIFCHDITFTEWILLWCRVITLSLNHSHYSSPFNPLTDLTCLYFFLRFFNISTFLYQNLNMSFSCNQIGKVLGSVADPNPDPPDPHVFGLPGSGSGSISMDGMDPDLSIIKQK
jgi:hypothetical protein